jgi:peptidoglycan/xylan/chitin deacetylase (PgdA/CDA1 family)
VLHVTFDDAYTTIAPALAALERLGVPATVFVCSSYADDGRAVGVPELAEEARSHPEALRTTTWDGLAAFVERGVEMGSHTVSHPHLSSLSDSELERELSESRARIEDELRVACRFLAYPYGEHDARVRAAARRCGYEAAFALLRTAPSPVDRFALPRIDLYRHDNLARVALKTSRAARPVAVARLLARHDRPPSIRSLPLS